jgi:hypothetical protein
MSPNGSGSIVQRERNVNRWILGLLATLFISAFSLAPESYAAPSFSYSSSSTLNASTPAGWTLDDFTGYSHRASVSRTGYSASFSPNTSSGNCEDVQGWYNNPTGRATKPWIATNDNCEETFTFSSPVTGFGFTGVSIGSGGKSQTLRMFYSASEYVDQVLDPVESSSLDYRFNVTGGSIIKIIFLNNNDGQGIDNLIFKSASAADAPTISSIIPSSAAAAVSFSAPGFDGGATITNYKYSTDGSTYTALNPSSTTSPFTISGLTNGTTYSVTIKAVNSAGDSVASNSVSVTPFGAPGTPDLASASDLGSNSTDNNTADDTPTINIGSGLLVGATVTMTATPGSGNPVTCTFTATSTSGSCTFSSLLNQTYSITASQTSSGVTSATSSALTNVVISKLVIPTPTPEPDLATSSDSGESNSDNITNDNTPTISYAGEITGTATIRATKAGSSDVTCTISSGSCTLGTLTDGLWSIVVVDTDTSGNAAISAALSITVDTVAPTATFSAQTIATTQSATLRSSELGWAFLIRANSTPLTTSEIRGDRDQDWNQAQVSSVNTDVLLSAEGLSATNPSNYLIYVSDIAGNLSSQNLNVKILVMNASAPTSTGVSPPSGTASVRQTISQALTFGGFPTPSVSYQWRACTNRTDINTCTDISGATSATYTLTDSDATKYLRVTGTANNSEGSVTATSNATNQVTAVAPSAPTSLVATPGDRIATISFTAPSSTGGAAITNYSYGISSSNSTSGLTFVELNPVKISSPVTVANGLNLANGTTYYVFLKAINSAGSSEASTSVMVTPATTPSAPTSLSCGSPCSSNISFTAGSNGGSAITNYKYSINGGEYVALSPADSTSPVTIPGLINGVSYTIKLRAVNAIGDSGESLALTLLAVGTSQKQVLLATAQFQRVNATATLATVGGRGSGVVTFRLARSSMSVMSNFGVDLGFSYPESGSDCNISSGRFLTKPTPGICYIIVEKAGDTTYSPWISDGDSSRPVYPIYFQDSPLPASVSGIFTSIQNGVNLNVGWNSNPQVETNVWDLSNNSGYNVFVWRPGYDANNPVTNTVPAETDLLVPSSINYAMRNVAGNWSEFELQTASPWTVLTNNSANTAGARKYLDTFGMGTFIGNPINYYLLCTYTKVSIVGVLYFNNSPGTPGCSLFRVDNSSGLVIAPLSASAAISDRSLTSGIAATTFTPITAAGGVGNKSYSVSPALPAGLSLNSSTGAITGTPTTASVSTSYTVTVTDSSATVSSTFSLSVNQALSAGSGSIPANIYKDSPVTPFSPVSISGGTSPITYAVSPSLPAGLTLNASTGVISGTPTSTAVNATYTITATDANGDTETGTFSTQVIMPTAPGAPTIGIATATGQTTATVTFTEPSSTGGSTITGYSVTASPGGITANGSSSPITVTGLTPGTTYTFTVSAINAIGTSSTSTASGSITTQSAQVAPTPSTPSTPSTPAVDPTPVIPTCDAACQAIRDAAAAKAAADAAAKAAADKAAADKAAADKAAADATAKLKADADARTASDRASAAARAAADAAKTAVERAAAAAAAKTAADAAAAAAAVQAKAAADAQAAANKAAADAVAAIRNSATSAAARAAATAAANKAAADAAAAVKAAATAAQNATRAKTAEANANRQVDIAINSLTSRTASAQATAEANAIAAAAKTAANEAAAAAAVRAAEARATATAAQKAAADAAARIATEQREAATAAAAAKAAAEAAAKASAEKIAATNAAKVATETLAKVLNEKATLAEQAANATDAKAREEIAKKIEEIETRLDEVEAAVEEAQDAAEEATAEYEEASEAAEEAQEVAAEEAQDAVEVKTEVATKTAAATKAAANATVAAKVAAAAKAAAAKVPSKAVISASIKNGTKKNSTTATVSGLKPGQKVKVTVNVKPKP